MMNRTQTLMSRALAASNRRGSELLLEALLTRGFLAFRERDRVWLGTGYCPADVEVLKCISGVDVSESPNGNDRIAEVRFNATGIVDQFRIATTIVALPENHAGDGMGGFTTIGPGPFIRNSWSHYCRMRWGAKLPVCPTVNIDRPTANNALDLGIALLVKVMPLIRVATASSCDGHGNRPAHIDFHYPWDAMWCKAVISSIAPATSGASWVFTERALTISPTNGYGDGGILAMLGDIQFVARIFLNQEVIGEVGEARDRVLRLFPAHSSGPSPETFAAVARYPTQRLLDLAE